MTHVISLSPSLKSSFSNIVSLSNSSSRTRSTSGSVVSVKITLSLTCAWLPRVAVILSESVVVVRRSEDDAERRRKAAVAASAAVNASTPPRVMSDDGDSDPMPVVADPLGGVPRCGLKADAESVLSNGSVWNCVQLNAASAHTLTVYPVDRGPTPPFLVALPYSLDANWILRPLQWNATTTLLKAMLRPDNLLLDARAAATPATGTTTATKDDDAPAGAVRFVDNVLLDNATNLTSTTGTVFIAVEATPEWMSRTSAEFEANCGFFPVRVEFVVVWPQKQLGVAQQVLVGLIGGGGALSGDPTAASTLAILGLLSCSGSAPALQSAGYFVSVFFSLGPAAVGAGNLGIIAVFFMLQYAVVRLWMRRRSISDATVAMSDMRFPALSIFLAAFLLPGSVYGGVAALSSGDNIAVGVGVLLVVAALITSSQVFLFRSILPQCDFVPFAADFPNAFAFERLALLPSSHWSPDSVERRFSPLLGTRTKRWCVLSLADLLLALVLSAATGLGVGTGGASCSVMPVVVACMYLGNAALLIALRPHRRPMDRVVFPIIWSLFGVLCLLKYVNAAEHMIDSLQLGLSTLQLWQNACSVWVLLRERQWRALIVLQLESDTCDASCSSGGTSVGKQKSATVIGGGLLLKDISYVDDDDDPCNKTFPANAHTMHQDVLDNSSCPSSTQESSAATFLLIDDVFFWDANGNALVKHNSVSDRGAFDEGLGDSSVHAMSSHQDCLAIDRDAALNKWFLLSGGADGDDKDGNNLFRRQLRAT
jgi:hypothetical protein